MNTRKDDIISIIEKSKNILFSIEIEYNNSLYKKYIEPNLKIDIKNFCENLRSCLDYIAKEIVIKYCPNTNINNNLYFPICTTQIIFDNKMKISYPDLYNNNKDLYDYLENIQPYKIIHNQWLLDFNTLTNENKHDKLVEQSRIETKQVNVNFNSGSVSWNPSSVKFNNGVFINGVPINPITQLPYPDPSQKVEIITWVDFQFDGINRSALNLLKETLEGIIKIKDFVFKYI